MPSGPGVGAGRSQEIVAALEELDEFLPAFCEGPNAATFVPHHRWVTIVESVQRSRD